MKIEVLQNTHMAIEHATKGSIVIHLCPLTDNAVYRFFSKDGSLVQNMVEKLFISAGLHELLQKRKELEIKVKISKKEPTPEEKGNFFLFLLFSVSYIFFITSQFVYNKWRINGNVQSILIFHKNDFVFCF